MLIQTDSTGHIVGMMERTFVNELGETIEQDTTGYVEVTLPEDFDFDHMNDYVYIDGVLTKSEGLMSLTNKLSSVEFHLTNTDYIASKAMDALLNALISSNGNILDALRNLHSIAESYKDVLSERSEARKLVNELRDKIEELNNKKEG